MVEILKSVVLTDAEVAAVGVSSGMAQKDWWPKIQPLLRARGFSDSDLSQAILFRQDDDAGSRFEVRS